MDQNTNFTKKSHRHSHENNLLNFNQRIKIKDDNPLTDFHCQVYVMFKQLLSCLKCMKHVRKYPEFI